jgi:hypothetical protein
MKPTWSCDHGRRERKDPDAMSAKTQLFMWGSAAWRGRESRSAEEVTASTPLPVGWCSSRPEPLDCADDAFAP